MKIEKKTTITISPFKSWKDWFLSEEDKAKNVHKTPYKIYCGSILLDEGLVPINFESISCEASLTHDGILPIVIDNWSIEIPEMNIKRKTDLGTTAVMSRGDTTNIADFKFTIDKG